MNENTLREELGRLLAEQINKAVRHREQRAAQRRALARNRKAGLKLRHQLKETRLTTNTAFKVGDRVQVDDEVDYLAGTVIDVKDTPDGPLYMVREVHPDENIWTGHASKLKRDTTPEYIDLDSIPELIQELRSLVMMEGPSFSLTAPDRRERIRALGKVAFLAGRASWLEVCAEDKELSAQRRAEGASA